MRKTLLVVVLLFTVHCLVGSALGQGTPGTVRFPTQLDTPDSLFRIKDAPRTTLASSLTPSSTSITVPSGGTNNFDISGSIKIDDEVIYYTSKTSNQFLGLTRASCGTSAASHAVGVVIRSPILSCHPNTLRDAIIAIETKVGIGDSPAASAATGDCQRKNPDGTVTWQTCAGGAVDSVFGRTGTVVAQSNDYTWAQVNKATSSLADITTRSAADLTSGTLPDGRFPATLPSASGANLTALNASNLGSGTAPAARLGSGTADSTTFLRGDQTWVTPPGGGDATLAGAQTFTGAKTFDAQKLIIGTRSDNSVVVANAPYRNSTDAKLYIGSNDGTANREIFIAGESVVNLASANVTGVLPLANGGTGNASLAYASLTDGATITWTVAGAINNATVTLGGNRTLAFSGLSNGMTGTLVVKQDGTGSRTLTLPGSSKVIDGGTGAITLSTAANSIDILTFTYDGTNIYWTFGKNYN